MDTSFPSSPLSSHRLKLKWITGTDTWEEKEATFSFQKECGVERAFLTNRVKKYIALMIGTFLIVDGLNCTSVKSEGQSHTRNNKYV